MPEEESNQLELLIIELEQKLIDFGERAGTKLARASIAKLAEIMAGMIVDKILDNVENFRVEMKDTISALLRDLDDKDAEISDLKEIQFRLEETINYLESK